MPKYSVEEPLSVALFSCFENVWVREGEYQDIPSKIFCLTVSENSVGKHFCAVLQELPVAELFIDKRRCGVSENSVEKFCLTVPKNFVVEPFCAVFQKISGGEKVYG